MPDAYLIWGGDLLATPAGDVALAKDDTFDQQRIFRRLLTNAGDYIWQPEYGAGLGQFVGSTRNESAVTGVVYSQILQEGAVAAQPPPQVSAVNTSDGSLNITIAYNSVSSNTSQLLAITVGN